MSGLKKDMGTIQLAIQKLAGTHDKDKLDFELANIISGGWPKTRQCKAQLVSGTKQTIYSNTAYLGSRKAMALCKCLR